MFSRVTIQTVTSISVNLRASIEDPTSHLVYAQPHLRALSLYLGPSISMYKDGPGYAAGPRQQYFAI